MPNVTFRDGPCDGQSNDVSDADVAGGVTLCRASEYAIYTLPDGDLVAVPLFEPPPTDSSGGQGVSTGGGNVLTTVSALGGWNRMMHALAVTLPTSLQVCERARRTIRSL